MSAYGSGTGPEYLDEPVPDEETAFHCAEYAGCTPHHCCYPGEEDCAMGLQEVEDTLDQEEQDAWWDMVDGQIEREREAEWREC